MHAKKTNTLVRASTLDFQYAHVTHLHLCASTKVYRRLARCRVELTHTPLRRKRLRRERLFNREISLDIKLLLDMSLICAEDVSAFRSSRGDTSRIFYWASARAMFNLGDLSFVKSLYREKKVAQNNHAAISANILAWIMY